MWKSNPACCAACRELNGQTLRGNFRPPLHAVCSCAVALGERFRDDLTEEPPEDTIKLYDGSHVDHDAYEHNPDGTILVTDDWTDRTADIPQCYQPFAVVETIEKTGQHNRTYYDGEGYICLQVHGGKHMSKTNGYSDRDGFHAHDFYDGVRPNKRHWINGKWIDGRELSETERRENDDLRFDG